MSDKANLLDDIIEQDRVISDLREALRAVVDGNDLAVSRGENWESWKTSPIRARAVELLSNVGPVPNIDER